MLICLSGGVSAQETKPGVAEGQNTQPQEEETLRLTLPQVVSMAQQNTPSALAAKHTLQSAYWNYRYYLASLKPSVTLNASPVFNRNIQSVVQPDGSSSFQSVSEVSGEVAVQISQVIPFTNGTLSLSSTLSRIDQLEGGTRRSYRTEPISIGYSQNMLGYNEIRWNRRIEPLRWEEAQKEYAETMELIASYVSSYFFSLAAAQTNVEIAHSNLAQADTLCRFAEGRYELGTITENEMLQLQLNRLREENNLLDAKVQLDDAAERLRSYLDLPTQVHLEAVTDEKVPEAVIPLELALQMALNHSPDPLTQRRRQLESRQSLSYTKASTGLKANLYMQFGLSQSAPEWSEAYHRPSAMQYASVSISIPLLDWGKGKGRRRMAQSNLELTDLNAAQAMKDFEQNVVHTVQQFNLQARRVAVASQTAHTAERRYDVARRLYLMGQGSVLDLNSAITEKDSARRNVIQCLATYWQLYYLARSMGITW